MRINFYSIQVGVLTYCRCLEQGEEESKMVWVELHILHQMIAVVKTVGSLPWSRREIEVGDVKILPSPHR